LVFWDSLNFLDPLAAILLVTKPKTGVWLTAIIIVVDVFHNSILLPLLSKRGFFDSITLLMREWMIISQIVFLLFVLITFKSNLREINLKTNTQGKGMKIKV
jgi:phosphatidylglycerophosphate synthase